MERDTFNNQTTNDNNDNQENTNELAQTQEPMSFTDKVIGIFTNPGDVFTNIQAFPPKVIDWLIPTLCLIVLIIASQLIQMNNPVIKNELRQKQITAMQKYVDEGKMTQEQFEKTIDSMDNMKGFQLIGIFVGVPIGTLIVMAFMALVYWLLAMLALKGKTKYGYVFVLMGLVNLIGALQVIVTLILSIILGKFNAAPNLTLLVSGLDKGPLHSILNSIDPFSIWSMIVIGIGLAKLTLKDVSKGVMWVLILWIVYILLSAFLLSKLPFFGGF